MPIQVVCSSCKARFAVSEKFAGKQGPCPKCKAVIKIPDAPAPEEEIEIHAPDAPAASGKTATGQHSVKPLARKEAKIGPLMMAAGGLGAVAVIAVAYLFGEQLQQFPAVVAVGLVALTVPLVGLFYALLRNDELEAYRGRSFHIRTIGCAVGYSALWGVYAVAATFVTGGAFVWVFIAIPFLIVGPVIAFASYDLELENAAVHFAFYLLLTILLRWTIGLPPVWASGA